MVARVALLLMICEAKRVFYILEQPQGSLLQFHPRFQEFLGMVRKLFRISVQMKDFGAPSQKSTWLYSGSLASSQQALCHLQFAFRC